MLDLIKQMTTVPAMMKMKMMHQSTLSNENRIFWSKQICVHFINFRNEEAIKVLKFGTRENKKSLKQRIWLHFIISFENNLFAFLS
jgi:hypothetical protein